jgi:hypothetical protein
MDGSYPIFQSLKPHHFTSEIINEIRELLRNPCMNIKEANLFVIPSEYYEYKISDTTGYHQTKLELPVLKERLDSAWHKYDNTIIKTREVYDSLIKPVSKIYYPNEKFVNRVSEWINSAKEQNMSLDKWLDSVQYIGVKKRIDINVKNYLERKAGYEVYIDIGLSYLTELAPDLEEAYLSGEMGKMGKKVKLTLARLQYKDYEQKMVDSLSNEIRQKRDIYKCADYLVYINTPNSYYAIAPVLLVDEPSGKYKNVYHDVNTVGWVVYTKLKKFILNLPFFDEDIFKENLIKGYIGFVLTNGQLDRWSMWEHIGLEGYLPKNFLKKAYEWMINNKNNYELLDKYKWEPMDSWYIFANW